MNTVVNYMVEASLYAGLTYLLYLWIKSRASFSFLRGWLLTGLTVSLIVPLINWPILQNDNTYLIELPVLILQDGIQSTTTALEHWNISNSVLLFYLAGVLLMGIRFLSGIFPVLRFMTLGNRVEENGLTIVTHHEIKMPFSFGPFLFWNPSWNFSEKERRMIIEHETVHIQKGHTLDILFLHLLKIIAWFHPLIYLYEREIKNLHEYQADQLTLSVCKKKDYIELLLQRLFGTRMLVGHSIFQTPIQKRIKMMKNKNTRQLNFRTLSVAILLLLGTFLYLGCNDSVIDESDDKLTSQTTDKTEQLTESNEKEVFKVVEQMPRFPGCEDVVDAGEKESCSQKKLLTWVNERINYPVEAKEQQLEGMVVVQFVVNKEGKVLEPTIVRDPGAGLGDEVVRVVKAMNYMNQAWVPGRQNGEEVNVQFHLPVKFELE